MWEERLSAPILSATRRRAGFGAPFFRPDMDDTFVRFRCPACNKRCKAPPEYAGRTARCTSCGQRLWVPEDTAAEPSEQPYAEETMPPEVASAELNAACFVGWEESPPPRPCWPAIVAIGTGVSVAVAFAVVALANLPGDALVLLAITAIGLLLAVGAVVALVAVIKALANSGVSGEDLAWVFLFLLAIFAIMGGHGRPTLRPLNCCGYCGYTWYPRGRDFSMRCPNCGRAQ